MIDVDFDNDDLVTLEAIVLDGGNLMHASQDLRPRVLEQARISAQQRKRNKFGVVLFAALVFLCSGLFGASDVGRQLVNAVAEDSRADATLLFVSSDELIAHAYAGWEGSVATTDWSLVDAFTELQCNRRRILRSGM